MTLDEAKEFIRDNIQKDKILTREQVEFIRSIPKDIYAQISSDLRERVRVAPLRYRKTTVNTIAPFEGYPIWQDIPLLEECFPIKENQWVRDKVTGEIITAASERTENIL